VEIAGNLHQTIEIKKGFTAMYTRYLHYLLFLLVILQLVACSTTTKQVERWDVSSVKHIAIIPPSTGNFKESQKLGYADGEQSLYNYVGKIAKDIIQESGKFIFVEDSKDADAILDCDIISFLRNRRSYQDERGTYYDNSYNVIYNFFLKRTSDGIIIGDRAGTGFAHVREPRGNEILMGGGSQSSYNNLVSMDRLREVMGIEKPKKQDF